MTKAAERPRTRRKANVKVTPDDFRRVTNFLASKVLVERERELAVMTRAAIAGVNLHQIASGGQAKSLMLREFARCILGANFYEKTLQPFTRDSSVIGHIDIPALLTENEFKRELNGYVPMAHVVFLDELLRASGPVRDAIMPLLNAEERRADSNGGMIDTPIAFFVTASNTWFDPDDAYSQAIESRVTIVQQVRDIQSDESFKELFRRHHARRIAKRDGVLEQERETITLEQFLRAQEEADRVEPREEFLEAAAQLRRKIIGEGLPQDPRHWMELGRVARANAWMAGRDYLRPDDLVAMEEGIGRNPEHLKIAKRLLQEYRGKFERYAEERRAESEDIFGALESLRPQFDGIPISDKVPDELMLKGMGTMRQVADLKGRVAANVTEAKGEASAANELHALMSEIDAIEGWAKKRGLPVYA